MTDNIEYLILEHLKVIRGDIATVKSDVRDIKMRLLATEAHQSAAHLDTYRQSVRLDELNTRLGRVEVRLDLTE